MADCKIQFDVNQTPGAKIRRLREERGLRPSDIQRISEMIKQRRGSPDFGISHATLNDIENGNSLPNVRKMFSLAVCFRVPLETILECYGVSPGDVKQYYEPPLIQEIPVATDDAAFILPFDMPFDSRKTGPVDGQVRDWTALPTPVQGHVDLSQFSYAWVGLEDQTMMDLIPAGSLVEIDRAQKIIESGPWTSIRDRPIYFCWTKDGFCCSWCEQHDQELVVLPHPLSPASARSYRSARDARVIGRVVFAWIPFVPLEVTHGSKISASSEDRLRH